MKEILVALSALALGSSAGAETLTNEQVIQLSRAGLSDDVIVAKIRASDAAFQLAADDLVDLKKSGVSSPVISAMLATVPIKPGNSLSNSLDPFLPHATGLYLIRSDRMERLDPTATNQAKTGGHIGHALTFGISTLSIKAAIPGDTARVRVKPGIPTFYFFFDEANGLPAGSSVWASGSNTIVTSPSQFTLAHLMQKQGRREAQVGSENWGGLKAGVMDHDRVEFSYELVRPGVYRVAPKIALRPGEYGFLFALAGNGTEGALSVRIYDFTVEDEPKNAGVIILEQSAPPGVEDRLGEPPRVAKVFQKAPAAPAQGGNVPVYKGDLERRYAIVGPISAIVKRETGFNRAITESAAFAALWREAKSIGADAVIHAQMQKPKLGFAVYQKAEVQGVAIKFAD